MENTNIEKLNPELFTLVQENEKIHDEKFETKNIGYLHDALIRFRKNKASIVAFAVIVLLILFAIIAPSTSRYNSAYSDSYLTYVQPKSPIFSKLGFWDGSRTLTSQDYTRIAQIEEQYPIGTLISYKRKSIKTQVQFDIEEGIISKSDLKATDYLYDIVVDSYLFNAGYVNLTLSEEQFTKLKTYAIENGYTSETVLENNKISSSEYQKLENEVFVPLIKGEERTVNANATKSDFVTDEDGNYTYYSVTGGGSYKVRVNYYNYYKYVYGISPLFIFGSNAKGQDLYTRLGVAIRFSLVLGLVVAAINIAFGILVGAIEGYYGGVVDIVIERIIEILGSLPTIVIASLLVFYVGTATLTSKIRLLLLLFFISGWTGIAGTVRSQFYRYKGQEYVLAARTLGAKDSRIIFRHILPNALGPIVTQAVLMIPSVIFTEASLSYLGIIDMSSGSISSVGTLLNDGQSGMMDAPFLLLFPAIVVSVLMIAFNIFGNGLRDAFNPSLRGAE